MRIQTDNFGYGESIRCKLHKGGYNYPSHLHQFTEIAIILKGEIDITVNGITRTAKEGDIAVIHPFAVHGFETIKNCDIWISVFSNSYILDFDIVNGLSKKDFVFTPSKSLFKYIQDHFIDVEERTLFGTRASVYSIFEEYARIVPSETTKKGKSDTLSSIFYYMSKHFKENISLKSVATDLNYSPWYISKVLSSLSGISFYAIVTGLRIEYAKQLILTHNMRMIDIALESGFSNERSFHRSFKQSTGMTPLEYKRLHG